MYVRELVSLFESLLYWIYMRVKAVFHGCILFTATAITFFWVTDETLTKYSLQLSAILLLTLLFTHRMVKPASFKLVESTISTIAVLLVVFATGGISSPLFFLNYFLLFELSLLLEPLVVFILSVSLIGYYMLITGSGTTLLNMLELLAFPVMTPLAYYLGSIYNKTQHQKEEIKHLEKRIENLKEELIEEELR